MAAAKGARMLTLFNHPRSFGFAARTSESVLVFVLNKHAGNVQARVRGVTCGGAVALSMVDTADHWGHLQASEVHQGPDACLVSLPGLSYTRIVFTPPVSLVV